MAENPTAVRLLEDVTEPVAKAASQVTSALGLPGRHPEVVKYVREALADWATKAHFPEFDIMKSWTAGQLKRDTERQLAIMAPALKQHMRGNNLSALEIGASWDVTVPSVLDKQLLRYTAIELQESPLVARSWAGRLNAQGLGTANKFRVGGISTELPIASNSQDLVYAGYVDTFVQGNRLSLVLKELSLSEALRVLKPGGKFMSQPFSVNEERVGMPLLSKYFPEHSIHQPSAIQLEAIKQSETSSQFQRYAKNGFYRTFVGIKTIE